MWLSLGASAFGQNLPISHVASDAHDARGAWAVASVAWGRLTGHTGALPATPRHGHGTGQQPLGWRQLRAWGERFTARALFPHVNGP